MPKNSEKFEPKNKEKQRKEWKEYFGPLAEMEEEMEKAEKEKKKKEYKEWKEYFGPLAEMEEERERMEKKAEIQRLEEEIKRVREELEKKEEELRKAREELAEAYKEENPPKEKPEVVPEEEKLKEYIDQNFPKRWEEKEKGWQEKIKEARTPKGEELTASEKRSLERDLYLKELGYSLKYEGGIKGALRGFFTGKEKVRILKEGKPIEKEGKPLEFKVNWWWGHPEKDLVEFLKNEVENKIKADLEKEWKEKGGVPSKEEKTEKGSEKETK